jgi:ElaB/YqjD/DUF883 family membrane-anchored ribosome-binding protein
MNAQHDLDIEPNPFTADFDEDSPQASPTVEAAERLKQAAGDNVRRLRDAAEAGFRTFRNATAPEANQAPASTPSENPAWEDLRGKLKDLHTEGEAWARENPTAAILTAAGAGLVLGLLLKR